jgi:hypothetical protein
MVARIKDVKVLKAAMMSSDSHLLREFSLTLFLVSLEANLIRVKVSVVSFSQSASSCILP